MKVEVLQDGRITLPPKVRRTCGIKVGDRLEISVDRKRLDIRLSKSHMSRSEALAGSFHKYAQSKRFPTKRQMRDALQKGLGNGGR